jgi:hypothetical protein
MSAIYRNLSTSDSFCNVKLQNNNNRASKFNKKQQNNVSLSQNDVMPLPTVQPATFSVDEKLYSELTKKGGNLKLKHIIDDARKKYLKTLMCINKNDREIFTKNTGGIFTRFLKSNRAISNLKQTLKNNFSKEIALKAHSKYRSHWRDCLTLSDNLTKECLEFSRRINNITKDCDYQYISILKQSKAAATKYGLQADKDIAAISGRFPTDNLSSARNLYDYSRSIKNYGIDDRLDDIVESIQDANMINTELKIVEEFSNLFSKIKRLVVLPADIEQSCSLECILITFDREIDRFLQAMSENHKDKRQSEISSIATTISNIGEWLSEIQDQLIFQNNVNPAQIGLTL